MVRPHKPRRIGHRPDAVLYKPAGIPSRQLDLVELSLDELEALRLVDAEYMDQATAAELMNISRATVGRLLNSGREKVARALSHGLAIAIDDGSAELEFYETRPCRGRGRGKRCRKKTSGEENNESSNQQQ